LRADEIVDVGLRADSNARLLRKRQRVLEAQGRAFADLAASAAPCRASTPRCSWWCRASSPSR
jgi:hypothetical protein